MMTKARDKMPDRPASVIAPPIMETTELGAPPQVADPTSKTHRCEEDAYGIVKIVDPAHEEMEGAGRRGRTSQRHQRGGNGR